MTINWFNQNEFKLSPPDIQIRIKMVKALHCLLEMTFHFIQIIKTNLVNSAHFQIAWNPNKWYQSIQFQDIRESVRWKMKESRTPTKSTSPWMCPAATKAGWDSIQGNSIQGKVPHSYPFRSLCKNYEKKHVWFSSHPKFKQNTSLSLFSFLVWEEN